MKDRLCEVRYYTLTDPSELLLKETFKSQRAAIAVMQRRGFTLNGFPPNHEISQEEYLNYLAPPLRLSILGEWGGQKAWASVSWGECAMPVAFIHYHWNANVRAWRDAPTN
jgi:hypothetical protein